MLKDFYLYSLTIAIVISTFWHIATVRADNVIYSLPPLYKSEKLDIYSPPAVLPVNKDKELSLPYIVRTGHPVAPEEVKNWVLNRVKEAGLDPDYVDKLIGSCENKTWDEKAESQWGDRGIFQINRRWHPQVSDECAFDYKCNTREAIKIRKAWGNWHAWSCHKRI